MPRWARFLSGTVTGLVLSLVGFFLSAYWSEGGPRFWARLFDFVATPAFWSMVWLFALMAALVLCVARLLVYVYDLAGSLAGFLSGGILALAYVSFLIASHMSDWGGLGAALPRAWPAALLFAWPFALSGSIVSWLWDRLD